jgi:hypothetical protein
MESYQLSYRGISWLTTNKHNFLQKQKKGRRPHYNQMVTTSLSDFLPLSHVLIFSYKISPRHLKNYIPIAAVMRPSLPDSLFQSATAPAEETTFVTPFESRASVVASTCF